MLDRDYHFDKAQLSPSGEHIAWLELDVGVCLFQVGPNETSCYPWPWPDNYATSKSVNNLNYMYMDWSNDSRYLALAKFPFFTAVPSDSDIWIFEVDSKEFINITEDNFDGWYMEVIDGDQIQVVYHNVPLDFAPT